MGLLGLSIALLAVMPVPGRAVSKGGSILLARSGLGRDLLELHAGPGGRRVILRRAAQGAAGGALVEISCGTLEGAFGLWVTDVDGDGKPDLVVALRKKARYDPVLANRLHVHALVGNRCVPLWRGTRLAGRFSRVRPEGPLLFVEEAVGGGRQRLACYQWTGFGYAVKKVLWQGMGSPPPALVRRHLGAVAPLKGAP